jgi:hypothetical protein
MALRHLKRSNDVSNVSTLKMESAYSSETTRNDTFMTHQFHRKQQVMSTVGLAIPGWLWISETNEDLAPIVKPTAASGGEGNNCQLFYLLI